VPVDRLDRGKSFVIGGKKQLGCNKAGTIGRCIGFFGGDEKDGLRRISLHRLGTASLKNIKERSLFVKPKLRLSSLPQLKADSGAL
jgi:hypothetical protein